MRRNCEDALQRWANDTPSPRSKQHGSVWTDGKVIWSYGTALVLQDHGGIALNVTKYSVTTSAHQNALRAELPCSFIEVDGVPQGWGSDRALSEALRTAALRKQEAAGN
jgi:hypothetical protein